MHVENKAPQVTAEQIAAFPYVFSPPRCSSIISSLLTSCVTCQRTRMDVVDPRAKHSLMWVGAMLGNTVHTFDIQAVFFWYAACCVLQHTGLQVKPQLH